MCVCVCARARVCMCACMCACVPEYVESVDIDECVEQSKCNQTCTNLPGTFFCSCDGGYELLDDGSTCLGK